MTHEFLTEVHQTVVDTIYFDKQPPMDVIKTLVTQKSDALFMDEDAMVYYSQQLNVFPRGHQQAVIYVHSLLTILMKVPELEVQFAPLKRYISTKDQDYNPWHFINKIWICRKEIKDNEKWMANWLAKTARYIAYCVDGGIFVH